MALVYLYPMIVVVLIPVLVPIAFLASSVPLLEHKSTITYFTCDLQHINNMS